MIFLENDYKATLFLDYEIEFHKYNFLYDVGNSTISLNNELKTEQSHGSIILNEKNKYFRDLIFNNILKGKKIKLDQYINEAWEQVYTGNIRDYEYNKHQITVSINI